MNPLLISIIGGVVRAGIAAASGAAAATAPSAQVDSTVPVSDDMQLLMSAIGGVVTILWTMWQKRKNLAPVEDRQIR